MLGSGVSGRRVVGVVGGVVVAALVLASLSGSASAVVVSQTVADGSAVAFTLRPTYDAGGADPLKLYIGYTAANVTTPEPEADGQASWYNLAILETGAFSPPEKCTPAKNAQATLDGVADLQGWLASYIQTVAGAAGQGQVPAPPTVPGPRHACTERFPGFVQSRYPATSTMAVSGTDNLLDKPMAAQACREDPGSASCGYYKQFWPTFRGVSGAAVRDGSFFAESTAQPSQRSVALLVGAGDGAVVSIGLARTSSGARLQDGTLITEASSTLDDICLVGVNGICTVRIDHLRQYARIVKRAGKPAQRSAGMVLTGVHGAGLAQDVDASMLGAGGSGVDLGGYLRLTGVSQTGTCAPGQTDKSVVVADAGGLLLSVKNGAGGQGGAIMIGGACARARIEQTSFNLPDFLPTQVAPVTAPVQPGAGEQFTIPGGVVAGPAPTVPVTLGAPRLVSRTITHYVLEEPLAWRTAPYWGVLLGLLTMMALAYRIFPRSPVVAPAARAVDRFTRRFLRG